MGPKKKRVWVAKSAAAAAPAESRVEANGKAPADKPAPPAQGSLEARASGEPAPPAPAAGASLRLPATAMERAQSTICSLASSGVPGGAGTASASSGLAHPEDIEQWLTILGLQDRLPAVLKWCTEQGAAFLEELADEVVALCEFLELSPAEAARVIAEARSALCRVHPATAGAARPPAASPGWSAARAAFSLRTLSMQGPAMQEEASHGLGKPALSSLAAPGGGGGAASSMGRTFTLQAGARKASDGSPFGMSPGGLGRTATITVHGPCSGVFGYTAQVTNDRAKIELQQRPRREAHRVDSEISCRSEPKTPAAREAAARAAAEKEAAAALSRKPIRRLDTVGIETQKGRSRESLLDRVHEEGVRKVTLDAGQTGDVYVLEADGEKIAVFKPSEGEHFDRTALKTGDGYIREEAAYLVDRLADSRAKVPVTSRASVEVDGRTLHGCVQQFVGDMIGFIEDFAMPREFDKANEFVPQEDAEALALLDMRVFNMDRHSGNLLLLHQNKPHGLGPIDHGCCLPPWWLLGEANFDAWIDWAQLQVAPTEATKSLARLAYERLPRTVDMVRGVGLGEECVLTLQLCTVLVWVGVAVLGVPCAKLARLFVRPDYTELSWLETQVQRCGTAAGAKLRLDSDSRGDPMLVVDDGGQGLDAQAFLAALETAFREQVSSAVDA